jgi:hypothetical protein
VCANVGLFTTYLQARFGCLNVVVIVHLDIIVIIIAIISLKYFPSFTSDLTHRLAIDPYVLPAAVVVTPGSRSVNKSMGYFSFFVLTSLSWKEYPSGTILISSDTLKTKSGPLWVFFAIHVLVTGRLVSK